ncbi:uncharacterized protein LOC113343738 isoform X1 [Papaver somniferum]|uniref:uncharacterized protein LOC113343738 isoform X1 n=1 Tax=Papaver somniferum TaxID=3469 RepID=UPI000E70064D|nr:uncharacterized protein LOC113343738 isoform X1 [Papaver somniferum]
MGHKKRNPGLRHKPTSAKPSASATTVVSVTAEEVVEDGVIEDEKLLTLGYPNEQNYNVMDDSLFSCIKVECEKALTALRRGNHTKALRLMKEASLRYESIGLIHRVQGTICVKVAALIEDPNVKQRHIKNAIESARRAVSLSPNSIEFAHFYANLLLESVNESKVGYDEIIHECDRALSIQNPIDPAKESLQDESQHKLLTPEERIDYVQQELRNLIQRANIASISNWMKNLNNGTGEKFQLIPVRRITEDPMEASLAQARRPNEIKKATKTPEERRKEIEVRVAAARLLQQKPDLLPVENDEGRDIDSSLGTHKVVERRKHLNLRKIASFSDRMNHVKSFWDSMALEKKQSLLHVSIEDLKSHFRSSKDSLMLETLLEALLFVQDKKTWKFWVCCCCSEKFTDGDSHMQHVVREHMGSLSPNLQSVLPQEVDTDWTRMLQYGSWKPVDSSVAFKMAEDRSNCRSSKLLNGYYSRNDDDDDDVDDDERRNASTTDNWYSRDTWDSDEEKELTMDGDQMAMCSNGSLVESGRHENVSSWEEYDNTRWLKSFPITKSWPTCEDTERAKLLENIHVMFQSLIRHKCLAASHLNKVIQYTMDELQRLAPGSQLSNLGLDQTPRCICFLGASQLSKVLKFLQELSHSCGLSRYPDKASLTYEKPSDAKEPEIKEIVVLSRDSSFLFLGERLFRSSGYEKGCSMSYGDAAATPFPFSDNDDCLPLDSSALLSWIFSGPSSGEKLASWIRLREENSHRGLEFLQMLEKEHYLLQGLCERKCEHLSYDEALQAVESLIFEELRKREHVTRFASRSLEAVVRKRQEELTERESDVMSIGSRFELEALSSVLKEAQSLSIAPFGYEETLSGVTTRLCDTDYGEDDDWRMYDVLHQADNCIQVALRRQKEQLSVELSKIDARIMRNVTGMQQLELKLGPLSSYDFRAIILPLVKSFMRAHLEELVDKDATERSEVAREAFLAELALDSKKGNHKGGDSKHIQEKMKDKKKNRDHRKAKNLKASGGSEQLPHKITAEKTHFPVTNDSQPDSEIVVGVVGDDLSREEEDYRRQIELEAEERKLEETLEYQRRIENEAKQKHLAELNKKESGRMLDSVAAEFSVELNPIVYDLDASEKLGNRNPVSFPCNGGSGDSWGRVDHGASSSGAFSVDNQELEHSNSRENSMGRDMVLTSESWVVSNSKPENLREPFEEPSAGIPYLAEDSIGVSISSTNGTMVSTEASASSVAHTSKRTNNQSQIGVEQVINSGSPNNGFPPSERRVGRQRRRRNSSTSVVEGSSRSLSSDKGIRDTGSLQNECCIKDNAGAGDQRTHVGTGDPCFVDTGAKSLRELHAEEDDEERFQADLKKAVRQSLDTFQARQFSSVILGPRVLLPETATSSDELRVSQGEIIFGSLNGTDVLGTGLKNEAGEYNCFLNVIIQSLWHLKRFREEFLGKSILSHLHVGDPCAVCALYDIFMALSTASTDKRTEAVAPTSLRVALSNLYPDSNFFQEAQMNDASEVLAVIFNCLHRSFTSDSSEFDVECEESNCNGSWDCATKACIAHSLFGMNIFEQMSCYNCKLESKHMKYTSFFHNVNASALRTAKQIMCADSSLDELLNIVEMNHQLACDPESGGCGKHNYIHHFLSTPPHVFTAVLGWQNTCESADDIKATVAALTTELDVAVLFRGLDPGNKHRLVSVVCYYGQHYHCFAYSIEQDRWTMYDDRTVKVIGGWDDVILMCERGHLQPQVLFFEAMN